MKKFIPLFVTVLMLSLFVTPVFALGENGSFETGTDPGAYTELSSGAGNIDNWTIVSGSIDYIGTYWPAFEGSRSIDMSGTAAGSISQTFTTVIGTTYEVTFDMAGNPDGGPVDKTMTVMATGGLEEDYTFDSTDSTLAAMGWLPKKYTFTATATDTILTFTSTTAGSFGPALDNVKIEETTIPDEDEDEDEDSEDEIGRPEDNHGWYVSTAEKEVRHDVAQSRAGMPEQSKKKDR
ncbi:MAG: hypothetical protein UU64_C0006G0063 [candidate division WWE3 bacterium GW2011_GWF2_41_45]|uniref:DUF642 domain-containing protein n=3 Tax=Katanobacteria TaxID=422282 RepID=A0A1F4W0V6_UNCKA|nr:MAG: hypothetical protein UU55_C0005G0060 [candidate division WWE3 bacterium GW2011_GWC2_41_23]KKS10312.1 MAG: hypothetical protein UU64_C0006G0063 [candidate division WWE3 bacterium GW2011_GWF2_41_45]KKS11754.1 MAG: hypothetical protein UU68_C0012G0013 [candidate division WWE3 bacterium GW2011_GWF1_41_53]KKS19443.1 MAG: hypothetical protein UU79_C0019G0013 [candidate division WWE3 bacterium GW2011_GWE1_41_72]KKS25916.1 MAG: hypothetical protein UU86_C0046G0008 [candidate division WWE3 bacte